MVRYKYPWLSFSAINTYTSCPKRYKLKYIDLQRAQPSIVMKRGKSIHEIFETFFKELTPQKVLQLINSSKPGGKITTSHIYNVFIAQLESLVDRDSVNWMNKKERSHMLRNLMGFAKLEVQRLYYIKAEIGSLTVRDIADYWFPYKLEEMYDDKEVKIYGIIDRINRNPDGTWDLIDYKTAGGKSKKKNYSRFESLQARIYMNCFAKTEKVDPKKVCFYFVYTNANPQEMPNIISVPYNKGAETRILKKVKKIRKLIEAHRFEDVVTIVPLSNPIRDTPDNQKPWKYKRVCAWCPFTEECYDVKPEDFNQWSNEQFYHPD